MSNKKIQIVFIPASADGKSKQKKEKQISEIKYYFGHGYNFSETTPELNTTSISQQTIENGFESITAISGDCTINEMLNCFFRNGICINPDVTLGVNEFGTGQWFVQSLELSNDLSSQIKLVKENHEAILSMPPNYNPKARVSVDAVEHSMIYKAFPEIGAIIHVHAWINGVFCTRQNYPCGTIELAQEVLDLLSRTDNPVSTAVGLKNHGLTITGKNLQEIFEKFSSKLLTEVEMFA